MKNMKKTILIFVLIFISLKLQAQTEQTKQTERIYNKIIVPMPRHEIGFSVGVSPIFFAPPSELDIFPRYMFEHYSYRKYKDGSYEKMFHLGSYAINYNYNINSKRSIGASLAWMGRHIEKYDWMGYDTINGSGWMHNFTLVGNWRQTYYRNSKVSLYWGAYLGATFCVRDKDILYKETHKIGGSTGTIVINNAPSYSNVALQINVFGINIGTKHILNMELGYGPLGIFRAGYKYEIKDSFQKIAINR